MGADLYIKPLFQRQHDRWAAEFNAATRLRDSLPEGSEEREKAQARVVECCDKMYERGYFRDPYNNYDLLWKFNISWWTDVVPMLDKDSQLSVGQASCLLAMLKERRNIFQLRVATLPAEDRKYFLDRYAELQKFLNEAIELDSPIEASL